MSTINDPRTQDAAEVTGRFELKTFSVTESEAQHAAEVGDAYNINSGEITSLTAGDATLLYFKNDEEQDVIIEAIAVGLRGFTGLSDKAVITVIKNPTAGDLITDATVVSMNQNRNFGSSKTLATTSFAYKGKAAGTITGGSDVAIFYQGEGRLYATINLELPRGSSLAIKVDSDATGGNAYAALIMHVKDSKR